MLRVLYSPMVGEAGHMQAPAEESAGLFAILWT
jgi:hypothetical protein